MSTAGLAATAAAASAWWVARSSRTASARSTRRVWHHGALALAGAALVLASFVGGPLGGSDGSVRTASRGLGLALALFGGETALIGVLRPLLGWAPTRRAALAVARLHLASVCLIVVDPLVAAAREVVRSVALALALLGTVYAVVVVSQVRRAGRIADGMVLGGVAAASAATALAVAGGRSPMGVALSGTLLLAAGIGGAAVRRDAAVVGQPLGRVVPVTDVPRGVLVGPILVWLAATSANPEGPTTRALALGAAVATLAWAVRRLAGGNVVDPAASAGDRRAAHRLPGAIVERRLELRRHPIRNASGGVVGLYLSARWTTPGGRACVGDDPERIAAVARAELAFDLAQLELVAGLLHDSVTTSWWDGKSLVVGCAGSSLARPSFVDASLAISSLARDVRASLFLAVAPPLAPEVDNVAAAVAAMRRQRVNIAVRAEDPVGLTLLHRTPVDLVIVSPSDPRELHPSRPGLVASAIQAAEASGARVLVRPAGAGGWDDPADGALGKLAVAPDALRVDPPLS